MKWAQIGHYHWGYHDEDGVVFLSVHNSNPGWEVWGSSMTGERRFFPPRYRSKQTAQAAAEKIWESEEWKVWFRGLEPQPMAQNETE